MKHIVSNRLVSGLAAVILTTAVCAFAWNVMGVTVEIGLAGQIASAREKWQAASAGSYLAVVRVIDYNRPTIDTVTVVVKNGKLFEASSRPVSAANPASVTGVSVPPDEAANYTLESLFDYASSQVADLPDLYITTQNGYRYRLRINPELGYIEEFKIDVCGRGPLAASVSECQSGFDVLDVRLGG